MSVSTVWETKVFYLVNDAVLIVEVKWCWTKFRWQDNIKTEGLTSQ